MLTALSLMNADTVMPSRVACVVMTLVSAQLYRCINRAALPSVRACIPKSRWNGSGIGMSRLVALSDMLPPKQNRESNLRCPPCPVHS